MFRITALIAAATAIPAMAQMVQYEGDVFPEDASPPWERVGTFDGERWIEDGWFTQLVELGQWTGPEGEQDYYRISLGEYFQGGSSGIFVIEWECETDAPSSIIGNVPTALSAGGNSGTNYHIVITEDLVRILRDTQIPLVYIPIESGTPHTFRLELCPASTCGEERYAIYIDNRLVDEGKAEGPYPTQDSVLIWGSNHYAPHDITTRWNFVTVGLPDQPIPATSQWGIAIFVLLTVSFGTLAFRRVAA